MRLVSYRERSMRYLDLSRGWKIWQVNLTIYKSSLTIGHLSYSRWSEVGRLTSAGNDLNRPQNSNLYDQSFPPSGNCDQFLYWRSSSALETFLHAGKLARLCWLRYISLLAIPSFIITTWLQVVLPALNGRFLREKVLRRMVCCGQNSMWSGDLSFRMKLDHFDEAPGCSDILFIMSCPRWPELIFA